MPTKHSSRKARLSVAQWEIVGQFNDHSFEAPRLTFDQVAKKVLEARPFPATLVGRKFRAEAKAVFDQERKE
jgi:hypothetical protein